MSTANLVPETWHLTGDDAKETFAQQRPQGLVKDAVLRLRYVRRVQPRPVDGLPAFLVFVQGVIAAVGIASALGAGEAEHRRS